MSDKKVDKKNGEKTANPAGGVIVGTPNTYSDPALVKAICAGVETNAEIAVRLGVTETYIRSRISTLRKKGVNLPVRRYAAEVDTAALNALIASGGK